MLSQIDENHQKNKNENKLKHLGWTILFIGLFGWIIGAICFNCIGVFVSFIGNKFSYWNRFYNPFILAIAYGMIILATQMKFQSATVNGISSLSLYLYMITGNQLLRIYPDNSLYDIYVRKFGLSMLACAIFVVIYSILKFVIGIGLSIAYKNTLEKVVLLVVNKECELISKLIKKIN